MKKKFFLTLLLAGVCFVVSAQPYNNEWIDYSKTYYKFKVGSTGLYRISQPILATAGLGSTPAQYFQLWRNGVEIPLYTSVSSGVLSASDYLEFYGEMNDGKADKPLYKYDSLQMGDKWSLLTDTAAFFLTVNTTSANKRLVNTVNNVAGNLLPAEVYFNYKLSKYYNTLQNPGNGIDYGSIVHSSAFDKGEGWTSADIYMPPYGSGSYTDNNSPLYLYSSGPAASFKAVAFGNYSLGSRNISVGINGTPLSSIYTNGYSVANFSISSIPLSTFTGDAANVQFSQDGTGVDHIVISNFELTYPRQYNFGGQTQFYFEIPASSSKYLAIKNFAFGATAPVLYDLANNRRMVGVTNADTVKFVLPSSAVTRKLVLLNTEPVNIKSVTGFTARTFTNYGQVANQGTYLIISHPTLFNNGSGVDNVELYRQYRASVAGGGYTAKTVDIDQLTDQFAFGIKHHPLAVRNFASFALDNFAATPKYFFLIGKGLDYTQYRSRESDPNVNKLALVPTFGWPASDNLLMANRVDDTARIPIGRLSAISGTEVGDYLDKVKQFELVQATSAQTIAGKGWMKNVAQITGAIDDPSLYALITSYMGSYESLLRDTAFGARVYNFSKNSGQYTAVGSSKTIDNLFSEGMSMVTYFGHSSPNTLEFNLDNPQSYNNTGKYPLFVVNGCEAGDLFLFDTLRPISKGTLSEKYIFTAQKGAIGFISSTHFGLPQQLNYFNYFFNNNIANEMYGNTIGNIMKTSMSELMTSYSYDFIAKCHAEEITLHGDPAVKINPHSLPDFSTQDSLITFDPPVMSVADDKINITAKILNIGKAITDSITVRFQQQLPDNSIITLATRTIKATLYEDTIQLALTVNPLKYTGNNQLIVTIDPLNIIQELSETNNTVTKPFTILDDEIRPVYPFNYAIVNSNSNFALYGSTANPTASAKQYVMEMDTSRLFNSVSKITKTINSAGGIIKFLPGITMVDSTVYYWRLAVGPVNANTRWLNSSFVYINGSYEGYNQSHYYQYTDDEFENMNINSSSRKFGFDDQTRKLLIRAGIYPYYSWDQNNINLNSDQLEYWGCIFNNLQFYVLDSLTGQPWTNYKNGAGAGAYNSWEPCYNGTGGRKFFEFRLDATNYRRNARDFFDSIPSGMYVAIRPLLGNWNTSLINVWKSDTATLGSGNSLWHKFHKMGLHGIDSFTTNRQFIFVFKKSGDTAVQIKEFIAPNEQTQLVDTAILPGKSITGSVTTPWLGPAKNWNRFKWNKKGNEDSTNSRYFEIYGRDNNGNESLVTTITNATDTTISFISGSVFPYLKLKINNTDPVHAKPTQLKYWMLTADEYPEGAVAPNSVFQYQDTLTTADTLTFKTVFKNISKIAFDSIRLRLNITNNAGITTTYFNQAGNARLKPLAPGDSAFITYNIPVAAFAGNNQVYLDINPDNDQPEQYHFNNVIFRNLYVVGPSCPNGNISFSAGTHVAGNTYQWQVNTGNGYVNVANGGIYSGATANTLVLTGAPTSMYGYKYKCIITNNSFNSYSNEFILKFSLTWTGAVNTAWENPGNWNCSSIPDAKTDVLIKAQAITNFPRVNSNAACRSITAKPGATVTITSGFNLTVTGPPGN